MTEDERLDAAERRATLVADVAGAAAIFFAILTALILF